MPTPTVGRSVHYYDPNGKGPIHAVVTRVIDDQHVNLMVSHDLGDVEPEPGVALKGYERRDDGCWQWPPRAPDEREKVFAREAPDAAGEPVAPAMAPKPELSAEEVFAQEAPDAVDNVETEIVQAETLADGLAAGAGHVETKLDEKADA